MRTSEPVRNLSASDIGVALEAPKVGGAGDENEQPITKQPLQIDAELLQDEVYLAVKQALDDGYAGVILSGPPGTSKSWYASKIALALCGDTDRVQSLQFHPSYQYEDFIQGWVSDGVGGFQLTDKHFLRMCDAAKQNPGFQFVMVIDEISRCDAARVFGEALTYLETSKRGVPFKLASGDTAEVPANLFIVATMNPWDLSVDELDFALERRFAYVDMPPRVDLLAQLLEQNHVEPDLAVSIQRFFESLQRRSNPMLHIGHAYFTRVRDYDSLLRVWKYQLRPHIVKVSRLDSSELQSIESSWAQLIVRKPAEAAQEGNAQPAEPANQPVVG